MVRIRFPPPKSHANPIIAKDLDGRASGKSPTISRQVARNTSSGRLCGARALARAQDSISSSHKSGVGYTFTHNVVPPARAAPGWAGRGGLRPLGQIS